MTAPSKSRLLNVAVWLDPPERDSVLEYLGAQPLAPAWRIQVIARPGALTTALPDVTVATPDLLDRAAARHRVPRQRSLLATVPRIVVLVREPDHDELARLSRHSQVGGLVRADGFAEELGQALHAVATSGVWISAALWPKLGKLTDCGHSEHEVSGILGRLTRAELDTLRLLSEGLSNARIAERRYVTVRTVKYHVENLLAKTGCSSRTELVALAHRLGAGDSPENWSLDQ